MNLFNIFQDGLVFASDFFFKHQGAYASVPERPGICDKCMENRSSFYAHGRYKRTLLTLRNWILTPVKVWKYRWLCLCCGRTMSTGPADVLPNIRNCTLVVCALLFAYLESDNGIHKSIPQQLEGAAAPRTLARYIKRAKAVCIETQQSVKEALIKKNEPAQNNTVFYSGLSPPEWLSKRHYNSNTTNILLQTLMMLFIDSEISLAAPCLLLARARNIKPHSAFLL